MPCGSDGSSQKRLRRIALDANGVRRLHQRQVALRHLEEAIAAEPTGEVRRLRAWQDLLQGVGVVDHGRDVGRRGVEHGVRDAADVATVLPLERRLRARDRLVIREARLLGDRQSVGAGIRTGTNARRDEGRDERRAEG